MRAHSAGVQPIAEFGERFWLLLATPPAVGLSVQIWTAVAPISCALRQP